MKTTKPLIRSALLLALAGSAVWAVTLGINLTNQGPHRVPLLLVDGPLGSTNQLQHTPVLLETNTWHSLADIIVTNHPTPYVDGTATNAAERYYRAKQLGGGEPPTNATRAPIYFNLDYHQEGVGSICTNPPFSGYTNWREEFVAELNLLDLLGIVSDQCLSDFMVDVINYHNDHEIFARFSNSIAKLGYHFHPSADTGIRADRIRNLEFWEAVEKYPTWEGAYFDWSGCPLSLTCSNCASLDTNRPGGIRVMEQAFGKPYVVDSGCSAPVALALQRQYTNLVTVVHGAAHTIALGLGLKHAWRHDWNFSPGPHCVYRLMGLYRLQVHSRTHIEQSAELLAVKQMLALLPPDRPHIVTVHGYNFATHRPDLLLYLYEFVRTNAGCRFISAADLPQLVDTNRNARTYAMSDLEEAARYLLRNWHGRPPPFIVTEQRYMSLASLFRALQTVLRQYYAQQTWPMSVTVPDFVLPPLGYETNLPSLDEWRTYLPVTVTNLAAVIQSLNTNEIPFVTEIETRGAGATWFVKIHAGELLNGMCTLFLQHRAGEQFSEICLLKGHIIPLSNMNFESGCHRCCGTGETAPGDCGPCEEKSTFADNLLDWYDQLQLWTLEPLDLLTNTTPQQVQ